jgi:hypothetical protein
MTFLPNESALMISTGSGYVTVGYGQSSTYVVTALVKPVTTGTYTLTSVEAGSLVQEFTGTLTGNVTIVYPPVVNLYVVANQTTDNGYSLTLTTGSGTTAIVPAGQQATVVCDGTNFFNANTVQAGATSISIVNGSAASPAINFASEISTGIFRPGSGQFAISILGSSIFTVSSTGISVTGSGNFTTGISGGVF